VNTVNSIVDGIDTRIFVAAHRDMDSISNDVAITLCDIEIHQKMPLEQVIQVSSWIATISNGLPLF
jgi:hypothetical protein